MLANGKGVHREVESEGSRRQSPGPMNKNRMRQNKTDEFASQNEVLKTGEEENRFRFYCPNLVM